MEPAAAERLSKDLLERMRPQEEDRAERYRETLLMPLLSPLPHERVGPHIKADPPSGKTFAYVLGDQALSIVQVPAWPGPGREDLPNAGVMSYPLARGGWTVSCEAQSIGLEETIVEWVFYYGDREILEVVGRIRDGHPDESQDFAHAVAHKLDARVADEPPG